MSEDPTTEQLRKAQFELETKEHRLAETTADEHETAQHERRAAKANYLREKLEQRAEAERERSEQE
jgi:hypothetical protein